MPQYPVDATHADAERLQYAHAPADPPLTMEHPQAVQVVNPVARQATDANRPLCRARAQFFRAAIARIISTPARYVRPCSPARARSRKNTWKISAAAASLEPAAPRQADRAKPARRTRPFFPL